MTSERRHVIVVGSSGILGRAIARELASQWHVIGTHLVHSTPDTTRFDLGRDDLTELVPDWSAVRAVVVAGAITSLAQCAESPTATRTVNVLGTLRVTQQSIAAGVVPIFLSSDAVFGFSGTSTPSPKLEETLPLPTTEYGRQKLAVEQALDRQASLVLRLTKIADGFVDSIAARLERGQTVRAATDQYLSLLSAADVARVIAFAIDTDLRGLFHVASPPIHSRHEWCQRIAERRGLDASSIESCPLASFEPAPDEPTLSRDCTLDASKLTALLPFTLRRGDDLLATTPMELA